MNAIFPLPPPLELAPIVTEIDRQLRGRLWQFNIAGEDQGLVLSGAAPSFYVKQLAHMLCGGSRSCPSSEMRFKCLNVSRSEYPSTKCVQARLCDGSAVGRTSCLAR